MPMPIGKNMGGGARPPVVPTVPSRSGQLRSETTAMKNSKHNNQQPKAMAQHICKTTSSADEGQPSTQENNCTLIKRLCQAQSKHAVLFLYDLVSAKLPAFYSIGYVVLMHVLMYGFLFAIESFQNLILVAFGFLATDAFFFYSKPHIPKSVGKTITSALKRARTNTPTKNNTTPKKANFEAKDGASLAVLERAELKLSLYFTFAGDNTEFAVMSHLTHLGCGLVCLGLSTVFNSPSLYSWAALIMLWVLLAIPVLIEYKPNGAAVVINIVDTFLLPRKKPKPSAVVSTTKDDGGDLSFAQKLKMAETKTNKFQNRNWSMLDVNTNNNNNNNDSMISSNEAPLSSTPMGVTRREKKPNKKKHETRPRGWSMLAQDENAFNAEDARGWSLLETENTQEPTAIATNNKPTPTTPPTATPSTPTSWDLLNAHTTNDIEPRARGWSLLGPGVKFNESDAQSEIELRRALEGRLNASVVTSTPVQSAQKQKQQQKPRQQKQNRSHPHHVQANQHPNRPRSTLQNRASVLEEDESFIVVPR